MSRIRSSQVRSSQVRSFKWHFKLRDATEGGTESRSNQTLLLGRLFRTIVGVRSTGGKPSEGCPAEGTCEDLLCLRTPTRVRTTPQERLGPMRTSVGATQSKGNPLNIFLLKDPPKGEGIRPIARTIIELS
jgi:hypothetical protein